jgi:hypothetical protein
MLSNLKRQIKQEKMSNVLLEAMTTGNQDIKDLFLDDVEVDIIGAENDPQVKELARSIPEYDDSDEDVMAQIESVAESLMETEI